MIPTAVRQCTYPIVCCARGAWNAPLKEQHYFRLFCCPATGGPPTPRRTCARALTPSCVTRQAARVAPKRRATAQTGLPARFASSAQATRSQTNQGASYGTLDGHATLCPLALLTIIPQSPPSTRILTLSLALPFMQGTINRPQATRWQAAHLASRPSSHRRLA